MTRHISLALALLVGLWITPMNGQTPLTPRLEGEDIVLGASDAPVTVIEYASLTCPRCADFHVATWPKIKAEYVEKGLVKFIFRDFPLDRVALQAAQIARCIEPERYHGFIEVLFQQQNRWTAGSDPKAMIDRVKQMGRLAGLSAEKAESCAGDQQMQNKIVASRLQAEQQFQVSGTPTIVINNKRHDGPASFEELEKVLKPLAKK
jgi:protein-disulfide isomerase